MGGGTTRTAHAQAVTGWLFPFEEFGGELMDRTGNRWGASRERIEDAFAKLPDPVLTAFAGAVAAPTLPEEAFAHVCTLALRWLGNSLAGGDTELSADRLGSWLQFADLFTAASIPDGLTPVELASDVLVPALNDYEDLCHSGEEPVPRNGYFDMDDAEQAAVRAFVLARLLHPALGRAAAKTVSKETLALFQRHHREPQLVAQLVRERGTLDAGVLGPILDSEAPAIAEGAL